jgi:hypothetical protein
MVIRIIPMACLPLPYQEDEVHDDADLIGQDIC